MRYCGDWEMTKKRFQAWWRGGKIGRPMMRIVAKRDVPLQDPGPALKAERSGKTGLPAQGAARDVARQPSPEEHHIDPVLNAARLREKFRTHRPMAEGYLSLDLNIGPGSMATYLGAEPVFAPDTIWYKECIADYASFGDLVYDPEAYWLKRHLEVIREGVRLADGDFLVNIPDIIENIDILSSLRGPQQTCFDLYDHGPEVRRTLAQIESFYFPYYDAFYDLSKSSDGSSSFTAFSIWGPGKTAKVQCDFSAMISPGQFRDFVLPGLDRQCARLDNTLYHLDGPDAIKHVDALMEIKNLKALQWTAGAGKPDGASRDWYPIYEKVRRAGKSLWIAIYDGSYTDWIAGADALVRAFGSDGLYLLFPEMTESQGERLMEHGEVQWG